MKIIAHRGFWKTDNEKNTQLAFDRAISNGFGIETDFRDHRGEIVISHDPPMGSEQTILEFLEQVAGSGVPLVMNVKSDGLAERVSRLSKAQPHDDLIFFDMSGPEHVRYRHQNLKTLNRISEFEPGFKFKTEDFGVWLDGFLSDEWRVSWLRENLRHKKIFVVSPELHKRDYSEFWKSLREIGSAENLYLCTDHPMEARAFFGIEN